MIAVFVFILGLIIGSFLNAVIHRLKTKESLITSRSKCVSCNHKLGARDLIPVVSFLFLKGKCRYCNVKISWQYLLVELSTAILFVLGYFLYLSSYCPLNICSEIPLNILLVYFSYITFCSFLVVIFVYDLKHYLILDKVVVPAIFISLIFNLSLGFNIFNLLLAALIVSGFFMLQFIISKGKWIGGGDIRLGFLMGTMLGWPNSLVALLLAYIVGSVISIFLIVFKFKKWGDQLPFGTFLTLATVISLLYGTQILNWYLGYL